MKNSRQKKILKSQIVEKEEEIKIAKVKLEQQKELQQLEIRQKEADIKEAQKSTKNSKLYSTIDGEVISTSGGSGYMVQLTITVHSGNRSPAYSRLPFRADGAGFAIDGEGVRTGVGCGGLWLGGIFGGLGSLLGLGVGGGLGRSSCGGGREDGAEQQNKRQIQRQQALELCFHVNTPLSFAHG